MTRQLDFFNTISLSGEPLKEAKENCNKQEERIMGLMVRGFSYTPFEVQALYIANYDPVPITSIRRAMTCLTKKGKLEKLDEKKLGNYGMVNHKWKIK